MLECNIGLTSALDSLCSACSVGLCLTHEMQMCPCINVYSVHVHAQDKKIMQKYEEDQTE